MMAGLCPPGGSKGTVQMMLLTLLLEGILVQSSPPTVTRISLVSTELRLSPWIHTQY